MALNPRTVKHGVSNGATISPDLTRIDHSLPVKIRLKYAYTVITVPGAPQRPCFTGAAQLDYPRTIAAGSTLSLYAHEALALVQANCATYR